MSGVLPPRAPACCLTHSWKVGKILQKKDVEKEAKLDRCRECRNYVCADHRLKCDMLGCDVDYGVCHAHIIRQYANLKAGGPRAISLVDSFVKCQLCFAVYCGSCTRERTGGGILTLPTRAGVYACGACVLRHWHHQCSFPHAFYFGLPPILRPILVTLLLVCRRKSRYFPLAVAFQIFSAAYSGGMFEVRRLERM